MAYPSLTAIKLLDLTAAVATPQLAIDFAMRHGLIAGSRRCQTCGAAMALENCRGKLS